MAELRERNPEFIDASGGVRSGYENEFLTARNYFLAGKSAGLEAGRKIVNETNN